MKNQKKRNMFIQKNKKKRKIIRKTNKRRNRKIRRRQEIRSRIKKAKVVAKRQEEELEKLSREEKDLKKHGCSISLDSQIPHIGQSIKIL